MECGSQLLVTEGPLLAADTARVAKGVVEYDVVEVVLTFLVYGYRDSETAGVATGEAFKSRTSTDDEA